ncbi:MAG TPA: alpha/beta fold hydrolase [Candidatus Limnocylindrales bacterium]|nr:alpha/beta fold hydrolase [Candidatus Limnocylindrales bacterium]
MSKAGEIYQFGSFLLDVPERRLLRDGVEIPLAHKVFFTLRLLLENAGRLLTREQLLERVWPDVTVEEGNLNHVISILRKTLGEQAGGEAYIETLPRLGYRFVAPVSELDAAPGRQTTGGVTGPRARQEIRFCITSDQVSIAYAKAGAGYPLVKAANWLNHLDFEWDSPVWRHWLCELGKHHTFIRYDERGNGLSDWDIKDGSFEAWVHDLEAVVDAAGVERFALMGISQGGPVAVAYAVRHPERVSHLILFGAYSRGRNNREQPDDEVAARRALKTLMRFDWGRSNPAFSQLFTSRFLPENATPEHQQWFNDLQRMSATGENAAWIMDECDNTDVRSLLSSVSVPTMVFHSERDQVVPIEEGRMLAAGIPNAKFVSLPSANHLLLEEEPAWRKFLAELGEFLGW